MRGPVRFALQIGSECTVNRKVENAALIRYLSRNMNAWIGVSTILLGIISIVLAFDLTRTFLQNNLTSLFIALLLSILLILTRNVIGRVKIEIDKRNWMTSLTNGRRIESELTDIRIASIFAQRLIKAYGLRFYDFEINSNTSITDIYLYFTRFLYINMWPEKALDEAIEDARAVSYDVKYGADRENDEKVVFRGQHGQWEDYLIEYCNKKSIVIENNDSVLEVGFGTGLIYKENSIFDKIYGSNYGTKYITDISKLALRKAKSRYKLQGRVFLRCPAEKLHRRIPPSSVDIYLSFRTFSSSLFDRKKALIEAKRVIKPGGQILITIPHMLPLPDGTYQTGLMRDVKDKRPTKKYRDEIVNSICENLNMLGFFDIHFDISYPYESFISARKGDIS